MTEMLHHWVTGEAARRGDATAVVLQDEHLSYGELETLSNQLARALKERGCARGDRVCVLLPKSPLALVCQLGIYKADCIHVPLEPSASAATLAHIVGHVGSHCLLAAGSLAPLVRELLADPGIPSLRLGWLGIPADLQGLPAGFRFSDIGALPGTPLAGAHRAQDTAEIRFTGGDAPHGVSLTHANVISFVEWAQRRFRLDAGDRLASHAPLSHPLSLYDSFGSFAAGAELHLVPAEHALLPKRLAEWTRSSGITHWSSLTDVLDHMARLDVVRPWDFPDLRRVQWHGESLPTGSLDYWMRHLPHVEFTGFRGPVEAGIAGSYHTVVTFPEPDEAQPYGIACGTGELLLLDHNFQEVRPGETGDLYIKGPGLSSGYWGESEASASAFPRLDRIGRVYRTGERLRRGQDGRLYSATATAISPIKTYAAGMEPAERAPYGDWSAWRELSQDASGTAAGRTLIKAWTQGGTDTPG
ncbi:MAG TPA: AMP-binding protein [Gammaproteobacteria bacterium]